MVLLTVFAALYSLFSHKKKKYATYALLFIVCTIVFSYIILTKIELSEYSRKISEVENWQFYIASATILISLIAPFKIIFD